MLELPAGMDKVHPASWRKGNWRQGWQLGVRRRAAQARCDWLRKAHVDCAQAENNRGGFLSPSPSQMEDVTGRGVGVGWHVGCNVDDVVDLGKQRSSHHIGVAQLTVD